MRNFDLRKKFANSDIAEPIELESYAMETYKKAIENIPKSDKKDLFHITLYYFGANLIERSDRMPMRAGIKFRMPYCDVELAKYIWNIPFEMKRYKGVEKGILREAMKDYLPTEIYKRKKSPFPRIWNPLYEKLILEQLQPFLDDEKNSVWEILNKNEVMNYIKTPDSNNPFFGQLMRKPQVLAWLLQMCYWLEHPNL